MRGRPPRPPGALDGSPPRRGVLPVRGPRLEMRDRVALLAQDLVRLVDHAFSFSRRRSLTTFGFAFPPVSFITCPTKKPSRPSLPPLYASTCPAFAASTASTSGSSSE